MLAAVHATEERLIEPRYMIQIFAHLAFSYTRRELFASENTRRHILNASQSEFNLHYFLAYKNTTAARCSLRDDFSGNIAVFNVYK